MQPIAYVFFKNTCREAMDFYAEVFGTTPEYMNFSDMPEDVRAQMPGVPADLVMHCALPIGDGWLHASDDPSGGTKAMEGCNVAVSMPTDDETRRVYEALSEGGEIRQPLDGAFWTSLFSAFTDRFGIRWMVMTDGPAPDA
ncbi:MAG TPA: VOC family protein [Rhodobacteraceae bacterium]|nr:VOC family protein [Paracoccaceae bacterium]